MAKRKRKSALALAFRFFLRCVRSTTTDQLEDVDQTRDEYPLKTRPLLRDDKNRAKEGKKAPLPLAKLAQTEPEKDILELVESRDFIELNDGLSLLKSTLNFTTVHELSKLRDRKSTRLNSSHVSISYAVFC